MTAALEKCLVSDEEMAAYTETFRYAEPSDILNAMRMPGLSTEDLAERIDGTRSRHCTEGEGHPGAKGKAQGLCRFCLALHRHL